MSDVLISPSALHRWVQELWHAAGSDAREAQLTADHLVQANLSGHDSHGVGMIPKYVLSLDHAMDRGHLNRSMLGIRSRRG